MPLTLAASASTSLPLPHQLRESVQDVRRRLSEWFAGMRFREQLFTALGITQATKLLRAGKFPPLPDLGFQVNDP